MRARPVIALLTDFGLLDQYVAAMKAVIAELSPRTRVIDISHSVSPQNAAQASYLLWSCYTYFPKGTIFVCVVDPGVGTARKILCLEASGYRFLAPDNGTLRLILDEAESAKITTVENRRFFRLPVSRTFHGRDVFAPVAAHLANGVRPSALGRLSAPSGEGEALVRVRAKPRRRYRGKILHIDHFGNLITNFLLMSDLRPPFRLRIGARTLGRIALTYAGAGGKGPFALVGSAGLLEVSVNKRSAARLLRARIGQDLLLTLG